MNTKLIGLIILAILAIGFVPIIFIWSINVLTNLNIEYNLLNWFAAFLFIGCVRKA
jgi:hypothetical protein